MLSNDLLSGPTTPLTKAIVQSWKEGDVSVIPQLIQLLKHKDGNVRRTSCSALKNLKATEAETALIATLSDPKPQVRLYAMSALGVVGSLLSLDHLRSIAVDDQETYYNIPAAQKAIRRIESRNHLPLSKFPKITLMQETTQSKKKVSFDQLHTDFDLSKDQQKILHTLIDWIHQHEKSITVGGYAGTGKTTLIAVLRLVIHQLFPKRKVAFVCYTGKASQILQQKLVSQNALFSHDSCGTIHSLLYTAVIDEKGKILSWRRNSSLKFDLIIVDEASMVTSEIWKDLCSYQIPIIAVGDHGQLPPIDSDFNLMEDPLLKLEIIHRQAEGNPILEVAQLAREEGKIPFRQFSAHVKKLHQNDDDTEKIFQDIILRNSYDELVLCGRNRTRVNLNQKIRELKGFHTTTPQVGETVICLKNNYETDGGPIYNGMIGNLQSIYLKEPHWYEAEIQFNDTQRTFHGDISRYQFNQEKFVPDVKGLHYSQIGDRFDFGYALTVHKAQGSQAKTVVLFEEFMPYFTNDEWRRWLYTAVTRASEELYIIGR